MNTCLETTFHNWCARAYSAVDVSWESFFAVHLTPKVSFISMALADRPAIVQLVKHLTVECCSNQMVPGSIPGGRIWACARASPTRASWQWLHCESPETMRGCGCPHIPLPGVSEARSFCVSAGATCRKNSKMTPAGLEPATCGSPPQKKTVHQATGPPSVSHKTL
jgi:hypothetical protein